MTWTDERVELLKKLWAEGLSASQIAAELGGVTRNAVIGKVHRLGLSGREKPAANPALKARKPRPAPAAKTRPSPMMFRSSGALALRPTPAERPYAMPSAEPAQVVELVPLVCERVTLMELREHMCRWPLGDPGREDFRFCGARSNPGSGPYCPHHAMLAYQPVERRRRPAPSTGR
jgi:GcrA cell cycle regulator